MPEGIGYRWLIEHHGLTVTQALRVQTVIGPSRAVVRDGNTELRTVQESLRPEPTLAGHVGFALKHEGVHLEALSRLFSAAPAAEIANWIRREPTGQYARRTGFLYERLTHRTLDVPDTTRGNYVEAIDSDREFTAATPINNSRWRVRDNLLGDARFSPQVHRTPDTERALAFNVAKRGTGSDHSFGARVARDDQREAARGVSDTGAARDSRRRCASDSGRVPLDS